MLTIELKCLYPRRKDTFQNTIIVKKEKYSIIRKTIPNYQIKPFICFPTKKTLKSHPKYFHLLQPRAPSSFCKEGFQLVVLQLFNLLGSIVLQRFFTRHSLKIIFHCCGPAVQRSTFSRQPSTFSPSRSPSLKTSSTTPQPF